MILEIWKIQFIRNGKEFKCSVRLGFYNNVEQAVKDIFGDDILITDIGCKVNYQLN